MPVKHAIWKVSQTPVPLEMCKLPSEKTLEDMVVHSPTILSSDWMLIGRQERTGHGGFIDLLAIAPDSSLVLIELKRDKTPREILAQAFDYASWVETLESEKIAQIYQRFSKGGKLDVAFKSRFGAEFDEDTLNQSHQIVIVAAELDDSTERIINYLNAREIAINVVFFQVFKCGEEQLLSRVWLIDPVKTQGNVVTTKGKGEKEPWNGEFYVSFGDPLSRSWEDARNYGYVSAGGGTWYSRTLNLLSPGDRIWVKVPKSGYVGVGVVVVGAVPASEFSVSTPEGDRSALTVLKHSDLYKQRADDPELSEYFVRVKWLDTVSEEEAIDEVGLFGNQNTVCQPATPKWRHTVDRLKNYFPNWNESSPVAKR